MTRRRWSTRGLSMVASGLIGGIAVVAGAARGDGPPAADPALEAILSEHAADVERLERRFRAARGERIEATLRRLKTLQDDHCRAARLDEALAVREAIRRLERGTDAPVASATPVLPAPDTLGWISVQPGQELRFTVTGSRQGPIWGTDRYTLDSRIGAAAVHAGALAVGETGVVRIIVEEPPAEFVASERHGVSSGRWGRYRASFRVERDRGLPAEPAVAAPPEAPIPAQEAPERSVPTEEAKPRAIPLTPLVPARPRVPPRQAAPEAAPDPQATPPVAPPPAVPAERGPARRPFD
ncbi:MAG: LCCL domain-containing protein [Planctomycetaceae bacterium]